MAELPEIPPGPDFTPEKTAIGDRWWPLIACNLATVVGMLPFVPDLAAFALMVPAVSFSAAFLIDLALVSARNKARGKAAVDDWKARWIKYEEDVYEWREGQVRQWVAAQRSASFLPFRVWEVGAGVPGYASIGVEADDEAHAAILYASATHAYDGARGKVRKIEVSGPGGAARLFRLSSATWPTPSYEIMRNP